MEPHIRIRLAMIAVSGRDRDLFISHKVLCFHTVTVYCIFVILHFLSAAALVFEPAIEQDVLVSTLEFMQ